MRSGADLGRRRLRHAGLGLCRLFRLSGHESGDGSLLRRASGGGEPEKRTAIVENARILGPLFLYNNLHVAHHMRGGLPWYQIPRFYRLNRAALIDRNGGLVYRSYVDVARRYLLTPHDGPVHPDWDGRAA